MEDIRIRHCHVRVLRHGGWSWGADPRQLMNHVTRRLPLWLAQALAEQLADAPPGATIPTLRVRVPVRLGELYSLPEAPDSGNAVEVTHAVLQRARACLGAALRAALPPASEPAAREPAHTPGPSEADGISPTPVIDVLCAWHADGSLTRILGVADAVALLAWSETVLAELGTAARLRAVPQTSLRSLAAEAARLAAACACAVDQVACRDALLAVIERLATRDAGARARQGNGDDSVPVPEGREAPLPEEPGAPGLLPASRNTLPRARAPARPPSLGPIAVPSVLPFVVTGVLSRLGYLDALRAALACARLDDQADCFAAALTCKLTPPPRRGWDREPATARLIAAMCGQEEAPSGMRMAQFLRILSPVCAPLDVSLRSRRRDLPCGVFADEVEPDLWAAMDLVAAQPLGWFTTRDELPTLCKQLDDSPLWFASRATQPELVEARDMLAEMHSELIVRRPLVITARDQRRTTAEYSIALAAGTALGVLAETLWGKHGETQPLLALQRLGDLSGTVSIEDRRVRVRPALGRRFLDLNENGLLRDIARVPWWPGRTVEFGS